MEKGLYLDIDMDYFVSPIELISVDNVRLYKDKQCEILKVEPLVKQLRESGITWDTNNIHCFTNHKKSYTYWWMSKKQNNTVIHIDAHSDLYRNSRKDLRKLPNSELGCYNYLWYAVRDGYADEIYWVLPRSQSRLMELGSAEKVINKALVADAKEDEKGLHILVECIDIYGMEKQVKVHVCLLEMLPVFNQKCSKVTIATSPEFIPVQADCLIDELFGKLGIDSTVIENISKQHKDMLNISEADYASALLKVEGKIRQAEEVY